MTKNVYRIIAIPVALAGLGLIVGLAGCCSIVNSCLPPHAVILEQPQSEVVMTNAEASFSVNAVLAPAFTNAGLTYQWQVNTYLLDSMNPDANWTNCTCLGATTATITITNVQLSDVGYYRVLVSAPGSTTVTSAAPYLQVIVPGSIIVNGTPIAGNGGGNLCGSGPFAGYIPYTNCPKCGNWGWAVVNTAANITATDTLTLNSANPAGSSVGYYGCYGDAGCGNNATVTVQPPFTQPPGSPRYQFTLYFSGTVPSSPRPYPLTLVNLQ